ncbi:MAG: hypothetical protein INH10_13875 [Rhodocyclaceae bacterium]|nr:hypothetical protein [Rhodocyclaceae bacterium]
MNISTKRRALVMTALPILTGYPSASVASAFGGDTWILDDGLVELTAEYQIQYEQGQTTAQAIAAFHYSPSKKLIRLRSPASIGVNGKALAEIHGRQGQYFYRAQVTSDDGAYNFVLDRGSGPPMQHRLELPALGLDEVPSLYRPYEPLLVKVNYVEPADHVVRDTYTLAIYGPALRFDLTSRTWRKENRYQFDRLPDIRDGAIVFRHITERAPPPGVYSAVIFRQHHVALSKISDAIPRGWATLSNARPFKIAVG